MFSVDFPKLFLKIVKYCRHQALHRGKPNRTRTSGRPVARQPYFDLPAPVRVFIQTPAAPEAAPAIAVQPRDSALHIVETLRLSDRSRRRDILLAFHIQGAERRRPAPRSCRMARSRRPAGSRKTRPGARFFVNVNKIIQIFLYQILAIAKVNHDYASNSSQ